MSSKFNPTPVCEICAKKPAVSFAYFDEHQPGRRWLFCCTCAAEKEDHAVDINDVFATPENTVSTLAQLHKKPWMDWREFMTMLDRFRHAAAIPAEAK